MLLLYPGHSTTSCWAAAGTSSAGHPSTQRCVVILGWQSSRSSQQAVTAWLKDGRESGDHIWAVTWEVKFYPTISNYIKRMSNKSSKCLYSTYSDAWMSWRCAPLLVQLNSTKQSQKIMEVRGETESLADWLTVAYKVRLTLHFSQLMFWLVTVGKAGVADINDSSVVFECHYKQWQYNNALYQDV